MEEPIEDFVLKAVCIPTVVARADVTFLEIVAVVFATHLELVAQELDSDYSQKSFLNEMPKMQLNKEE